MNYNLNASTKSLGDNEEGVSTQPVTPLADNNSVEPISILETRAEGVHRRSVDDRSKLIRQDSDEAGLMDAQSPLGQIPKVPMYEKRRKEALD